MTLLDVAKARADSRPAELHYEARLALLHPIGDVVRLHFGGTAPVDAGRSCGT